MSESEFKLIPICERNMLINTRNYLPHKPRYTNFNSWKRVYYDNMIDIYNILAISFDERYEHTINWEDITIFDKFCKFIYDCSSKYYVIK